MNNISSKTERRITVLQNITVKMAASNYNLSKRNSSTKKRRVTSSMIYLDEEPVFSDSEEEKEYMRNIFGKTNYISAPNSPKNREAEVQCDIIPNNDTTVNTLTGLIKRCSLLNPDVTTRFSVLNEYLKELICLCKLIQMEMHEEDDEKMSVDQFTQTDQVTVASTSVYASSEQFMPSSCGIYPQGKEQPSSTLTENNLIPSAPFVFVDQSPSTDNRKASKKITKMRKSIDKSLIRHSMRERRPPRRRFNSACFPLEKKQIAEVGKQKIKKKLTKGLGKKIIEKKLSKSPGVQHQRIGKHIDKSYQDMPERRPDFDNISTILKEFIPRNNHKPLTNTVATVITPTQKKLLKSLGRNWMKPNKSFCLEETFKPPPHYASLQQEKRRRLYSPSRWLESNDFLNSMTQRHGN